MNNKEFYNKYIKLFLEENSKLNLISKNDEKFLWEKHIFDSLAISLFFEEYGIPSKILDIGTGGGFPSVPIALTYPQIQVYALDSISKKINSVSTLKEKLNLANLHPICSRVENYNGEFQVITSRAVSKLKTICEYALPKLKRNGYFVAYKSKKSEEEIAQAEQVLKKYKTKLINIIDYKLPLNEEIVRKLIILKKI